MKFRQMVKKYAAPVVVASAGMAANAAFAIDQATIDAAKENGLLVVGIAVTAVISIAALGFGLNMVKGLISK